jgi:DNA-binding beta-propeller fold protein YncE
MKGGTIDSCASIGVSMKKEHYCFQYFLVALLAVGLMPLNQAEAAPGDFLFKFGGEQFNQPNAIAVDANGNEYVTDTNNHRIMVLNSETGILIRQWGIGGSGDGQFNYPYGIAVNGIGNVYVADTSNNRIQVFTSTGQFIGKWGSYGSEDGQFNYPRDIAVDESGNVYVNVVT